MLLPDKFAGGIENNPFSALGLRKGSGNRHRQPPPEEQMWSLLDLARRLTPPSFADWLDVGCFTAMRPGELDALSWRQVDFESEVIEVDVQWNVKTASFTEPKYGPYTIALVDYAKKRLLRIPRDAAYVFTTLYLATRHYFGYTR